MQHNRRTFHRRFAAAALLSVLPLLAAGQDAWPARPVRIVVGFPPGQSSDILARLYADELSKSLGQPVMVENVPGAGGRVASEQMARTAADGYSIYFGSSGPLAIAPHLYKGLKYNTVRDFEPVGTGGVVPMVLVVNASSPYKTLADLVSAGRAGTGSNINYGSSGNGGTTHLTMESFKSASNTKFTHVPYKGSTQALTDLVGNSIQVLFEGVGTVLPFIRSGTLRPLAISTSFRIADLQGVPVVAETFPGFERMAWGMFLVPKGTSEPILRRLGVEFERLNGLPQINAKLNAQGMSASSLKRDDLRRFLESEYEAWGKTVRASGVTVD